MRKYGPYDCSLILHKIYFQSFIEDLRLTDTLSENTIMLANKLRNHVKKSKRFGLLEGPVEFASQCIASSIITVWSLDLYDKTKIGYNTIGFK